MHVGLKDKETKQRNLIDILNGSSIQNMEQQNASLDWNYDFMTLADK